MTRAGVFRLGESGLDVSPLEQQREFSYQIRIYDRSGDKVAEIASGIKGVTLNQLQFGYLQDGGCADFSFTLGEKFTQATIGYNYRVEMCFYNQPNPWYQGFITKLPEKGTSKVQTYSGYGYVKQLGWIRINEEDLAEEVADIVEDTLDYLEVDGTLSLTDIKKNSDKLDSPIYAMVSNIYWERIPSNELFERLRQLAGGSTGDYEWGVDEEREFYFRAINTNVLENFWIGKHLDSFKGTEDPDSVRNRLYVKCGRLTDGSDYVLRIPVDPSTEPTVSQTAYGLREEVIVAPEFWPRFDDTDIIAASPNDPTTDPGGSDPDHMVDGIAANYWDSDAAQGVNDYIRIDLGAIFDHIARVVVDSSHDSTKEQYAREFEIRVATTLALLNEDAAIVLPATVWGTDKPDVRFEPRRGRFIEVRLTAADAEDWHVTEFEAYELDTSDIERWAEYMLAQKENARKKATLTIKGVNKLIEKKHVIVPFKPCGKWGIYTEDGTHIDDYQVKSVKYSLTGRSFDMSAELGQLETETIPAAYKRTLQRLEEYNMSGIRKVDDLAGGTGVKPVGITRTMIGKEMIETPHLKALTVTTEKIDAGAVTAGKITVADLADIVNLLTVAAGRITIGANELGAGLHGIKIIDNQAAPGPYTRVEIGHIAAGVENYGIRTRDETGELTINLGEIQDMWKMIHDEYLVANTDQWIFDTGLDGDNDNMYCIVFHGICNFAGATQFHMRINNDAGANYGWQTVYCTGAGAVGATWAAQNEWIIGVGNAVGELCQMLMFLQVSQGHARIGNALLARGITGTTVLVCDAVGYVWDVDDENIVRFDFLSDRANGIQAGSRVTISKIPVY